MINKTFGKLLVLERDTNKPSGHGYPVFWKCKCECGNIISVRTADLKNGHTQSCGCLQKQRTADSNSNNLLGQRFGKLKVIEKTNQRQGRHIIWKCQCECGNIVYVLSTHLTSGHTTSCGCIDSLGEQQIAKILRENGIMFETQKTFQDCRFPTTTALAKFDFYVNNKYVIEYDGIQHFQAIPFFGGENALKKQKERDNFKTQWCKEHNIPIIRIPYTIKNLTVEDLLLKGEENNV